MSRGKKQEALLVLERAVTFMPDSIQARLRFAEALERIDLKERARGEYGKILLIDPKNAAARKRLSIPR